MDRRRFLNASALAIAGCAAPSVLNAAVPAKGEVRLIGKLLRIIHPGLHRYLSPADFETGLERLGAAWQKSPGLQQRYLALSRFLASIRCGHSYANFFNQKASVSTALFDLPTRLPIVFRWIAGEMVVLADQSGTGQLPQGSVISAVNGVSARQLLASLLPYARVDGNNPGKQRALLSVGGNEDIEFFDVFHGLLYGPPNGGLHRLMVRRPGSNSAVRVDVPALSLSQRKAFIRKLDYRCDQPVWDWQIDASGIAVLTMPGWAMYNSKWDWQTWLNDRLDSLKGAKGLIVDLRANEGGNDCGDLILARLAGKDIVPPAVDRLVRYRKVDPDLNPYLDTWDDSFRDWGELAKPFNARFLRLERPGDPVILAKGPRVDVPMAVLTSPQNSSATFQFVSLARSSGLGTIVGETTGGNQRGINGGAYFFVRLPESGIEFDLPLIGYYPQSPAPNAGLSPDIRITQSAADLAADRDPVMARAKHWLLAN